MGWKIFWCKEPKVASTLSWISILVSQNTSLALRIILNFSPDILTASSCNLLCLRNVSCVPYRENHFAQKREKLGVKLSPQKSLLILFFLYKRDGFGSFWALSHVLIPNFSIPVAYFWCAVLDKVRFRKGINCWSDS